MNTLHPDTLYRTAQPSGYDVIPLDGYTPSPEARVAVFDIEANGLLHEATTIHCIAVADKTTGEG